MFLTKKAQKSIEQVEWFDFIGDMAYNKRNHVFSPFLAVMKPFGPKWGKNQKFENSKKYRVSQKMAVSSLMIAVFLLRFMKFAT